MAKISGSEIKTGLVIEHEGSLWVAVKSVAVKPGKGPAYNQVELKNLIDGRKLKSLKKSQAKRGKFAIRIDPRKFSHGAHVLTIKGTSSNPACGTISQAGSFVRPFTAARRVKFTG